MILSVFLFPSLIPGRVSYLDVVDPDHVGAIQGDGITTPDVVGVEVGDVDVLDDDVGGARDDAETLALDNTGAAAADQTLVGADRDAQQAGVVVRHARLGRAGLVVVAPVVLVDGELAGRGGTPGSATRRGRGALGAGEVERLGQHDDAGRGVAQVGDQLGRRGRVDGGRGASARDALGETLGGARDGHGRDGAAQSCCYCSERSRESHVVDEILVIIIFRKF